MTLFGLRGRLQEAQRVCEDGDEAAPTTIVEVMEIACASIEMKRKNAMFFDRYMDMRASHVAT